MIDNTVEWLSELGMPVQLDNKTLWHGHGQTTVQAVIGDFAVVLSVPARECPHCHVMRCAWAVRSSGGHSEVFCFNCLPTDVL